MKLPDTISDEELCQISGLTDRRHRQMAEEGWFPPPIKTRYQLIPTMQGLIKFYGQNANGRIRQLKEDTAAEKLRQERVKANLLEEKVSTKAELETAMTRFVMQLKSKQMNVPRAVSRELSMLKDPVEIETRLEGVLRDTWDKTDLTVCKVQCPECGKEIAS